MARPVAWLDCVLRTGHQWGPWDPRRWENLLGLSYSVRWCMRCGKRDIGGYY